MFIRWNIAVISKAIYGVIGDATSAGTRPASGIVTCRGETIGVVSQSNGSGPARTVDFVETVTGTIDFTKTIGAVTIHVDVANFISGGLAAPLPFAIDLTGDLVNGQIDSTTVSVTGLGSSAIPGSFRGLLYGDAAVKVGGVFSASAGDLTVTGNLLTAR